MGIRVVRQSVLCVALCVSANVAQAGGVAILDAPGLGVLPDIQTAINAAVAGDVLLIGPGTYPPFTIDNKTLYLYALPGDAVDVAGTITIQNLGPAKKVVLAGLSATGAQSVGVSQPAVLLNNNAGHVRFQNCSFTGGRGLSASCSANGVGGRAVSAIDSIRVAFTRCMIVGGAGYSGPFPQGYVCNGGNGGDAIYAQGSALALFESTLIGGAGGANGAIGGNGGIGLHQLDLGAVISGCTLSGGDGGDAWDTFPDHAGNGGVALLVDAAAQVQLFENTYSGGAGGLATVGMPWQNGSDGATVVGSGVIHYLNVASRHFGAQSIVADQTPLAVTVQGEAKDLAYVVESSTPAWQLTPRFTGVWLVPSSAFHNSSSAFLDPSGDGVVTRTMQSITSPPTGRIAWLQGIAFGRFNERALATPLQVLVIDRAAQPDCDGNGTCDWLDFVEGAAADCDGDLASDACEILAGAPDCNANSIPDTCDLAHGTSMDLNHNSVPDECDQTNLTFWVDAAAAPGGTGTAQAPYQSLQAAFDGALSGDVIVVRDGTYTGPLNNGLNALGRTLTVIGEHGPANCVVDPALSTLYFVTCSGTSDVKLEGFTLRNARRLVSVAGDYVTGPTPRATLVDCVIEQCTDSAVWNTYGELRAERCVFRSNSGVYAAAISNNGGAQIIDCSFEFNHAFYQGGAISCSVRSDVRIQGCRFVGNTAGTFGGAISGSASDGYVQPPVFEIVNCRFETNAAAQGGALYFASSMDLPAIRMRVSNSSFFGNTATVRGGSIRVSDRSRCDLWNSILWNGSAPAGAELSVGNGALPSELLVSFCDVQGGQAAVHQNGGTFVWGAGSFALDPFFIDNDLHLAPGSPCTDAGNNALVALDLLDVDQDGNTSEPIPFDFDGAARFIDVPSAPNVGSGTPPLVDLGCYEHP